jgi:hypothetical protein
MLEKLQPTPIKIVSAFVYELETFVTFDWSDGRRFAKRLNTFELTASDFDRLRACGEFRDQREGLAEATRCLTD